MQKHHFWHLIPYYPESNFFLEDSKEFWNLLVYTIFIQKNHKNPRAISKKYWSKGSDLIGPVPAEVWVSKNYTILTEVFSANTNKSTGRFGRLRRNKNLTSQVYNGPRASKFIYCSNFVSLSILFIQKYCLVKTLFGQKKLFV